MRSKDLDEYLELLKPVYVTDCMGAEVTTYESVCTIHAGLAKFVGDRSEEVGEHFPDYSARFYIRYAHPVQENWRVRHLGGHLYTVTNIISGRRKGYKLLLCERVNE